MSRLRNTPCTECRKHRRKCIQTSSPKCSRCERLGKVCLQPTKEIALYAEGNDMFDDLKIEAAQLEWAIKQMEIQMEGLSCRSNSNALVCQNIQTQSYQWKVQLKNGSFQIETGIKSINDLLQFQSNDILYLSPFSSSLSSFGDSSTFSGADSVYSDEIYRGDESGLLLHFGSKDTIPFTIKMLVQSAKLENSRPVKLLLPRILCFNSIAVMDQLIKTFFSCHNMYKAALHEKSFMENYNQLNNPMTDLLSISLCAYVCSSPCDHLYYTPLERRQLADYFFELARSIILDQFDLPEKRLENIVAINLITKYMHMTLKYNLCQKLNSLAFQICLDIMDQPPELTEHLFKDELYRMLYTRHLTLTARTRRILDYIGGTITASNYFQLPKWVIMQDEREETKRYVKAQNWLLDLLNHPFIDNFTRQVEKVLVGRAFTLSFESIVRLDDVIDEWIVTIPEEFRLCIAEKDMDLCKAILDKTTDTVVLILFIQFQSFLINGHSCLLQPVSLGSDNNQLLSFVHQRSLERSLNGCKLVVYAILRLSDTEDSSTCYYTLAACDYLFNAMDILLVLCLSTNPFIAKESRSILRYCMERIDQIKFMGDHRAPSETSPLFSGIMNFRDETTFKFDYYDKFPQPWFAMMYDVSRYILCSE